MARQNHSHFDAAHGFGEGAPQRRDFVYVVIFVVVIAFGGFVWNLYGGRETPRISAEPGAYKVLPPVGAPDAPDRAEENALYSALEGREEPAAVTPRPGPEAAQEAEARPQAGGPQLGAAPHFVSNGPFVAQVAALQSEAAVEPAWTRLASRAPGLFQNARLDVERADLGARGVYYRVRAGYFADRENAGRFCDRIKRMGQDCIVVAR